VGRWRVKAVLLDTHSWAWSLTGDDRLSDKAIAAMSDAETVLVSPISFFEIGQKLRIGKWPEMTPFVDRLPSLLKEQGGTVASLDALICLTAGTMPWAHRDPFDRLLAATASHHNLPIISADTVFDGLVTRLW
jgi:PIN domain nuclease of toxin-antitoxin system